MASDMGGNGEGGAGRGKVPQEYQTSASECGRSAVLGRRRKVWAEVSLDVRAVRDQKRLHVSRTGVQTALFAPTETAKHR